MHEEADTTTQGFTKEEEREAMEVGLLLFGFEESKEVLSDDFKIRDESFEARRSAMAFDIHGESCKSKGREADSSVLEGPTDIVGVAMDHTDASFRKRRSREPSAGEEAETSR